MLRKEIRINALDIEDEEVRFQIEITNGINSTSINFYGYADEFKDFANGLLNFPKTINDTVQYELGEIDERWAYYILLRVFCYESIGHSAIHVNVDNNRKQPYASKSEFYLMTVPASLNKLGQLLNDWNPKTIKEIVWSAE